MFRPLLISLFLTSTALADTWTVDDDGKADFSNIQAAVDASSDGDEIIVMPGTYTSTADEVVDMRGKEIWLHSSKGAEVTIIDGEGLHRVLLCITSESKKTIIEGFTITNGNASANNSPQDGGGIRCENSSPTIINCTISDNSANYAGGIECRNSSPRIINCTIFNNTAMSCGGGFRYGGSNDDSSPTLTNCIFENNTALAGGGWYSDNYGFPTLTDCTFTNNTADSNEGGGMSNNYGSPTLIDCTFTNNFANGNGGGMSNNHGSSPTLDGCTFTNNNAINGGGGMYNTSSDPTLTDTTVCGNTPDQINGNWIDNGGNTILDLCPLGDKDEDGIDDSIDNCYLYNPDQADCNDNGIGDVCDVADQTSFDCDQNGVPDECQPDCDGDGWIDPCDNDGDCDGDGIPDNCELDCNENSIPDDCDIIYGISEDCNENGVPDECDIADGLEEDCNGNGVPDSCDLIDDPSLDCDGDGVFDSCAINDGLVEDCNGNNIPDLCEIDDGTEQDCNGNDVPDSCELEVVFQEEAKLLSSDGEWYDEFGWRLAISGDTVVAGASGDDDNGSDSGSAYIYKLAGGVWQETKLLASDGASNDYFGISVATSGDTVVVGAHFDDDNGNDSGSAYIYRFDGSDWIETKLIASDGATDDLFGVSVATSGDTVVVGAYRDDDNGFRSGSAYIYRFDGSSWIETKLLASDGASNDYFGISVATSGDTVVVGASGDDDNGSDSGSAYIYGFDGSSWIETKLLASDGATDDLFGVSVATSGDTVVVGASGDDDNGFRSGSAYIYGFDGSSWIETKLLASDGASNDHFGRRVATNGDTVVVGASGDDDNIFGSGSAYIYGFDGSSWIETKLLASDAIYYDLFGSSVAISGDKVVVGAIGEYGLGSVYIFGATMLANDCNANGVPDECDIADGTSNDVNGNGTPDECEVDCNGNGVPDHWDIKTGTSEDCNANGVPDECDIDDGTSNDVNGNGIPDECEVDCNSNGYPDDYDIQMEWSYDVNGDGIPDECQCIADITGDNMVDVNDLLAIIGYWGSAGPLGDVNEDGIVDVSDLLIVVGNWGPCE